MPIFEELLNIILPTRCIWCRELGSAICNQCSFKINQPVRTVHRIGINGYAINEYSDDIATLISEFKETPQSSLASFISTAMIPALKNFDLDNVVLVPMPSKKKSFAKRGFNPAQLLARQVSKKLFSQFGIRVRVYNCLQITRDVNDQAALSGSARRINLNGSMSSLNIPIGYSAILIDDVITSGATLREAKRSLLAAGAQVLGFVTFAETPPRNLRKSQKMTH
jgi:ComF family protein